MALVVVVKVLLICETDRDKSKGEGVKKDVNRIQQGYPLSQTRNTKSNLIINQKTELLINSPLLFFFF